VSPETLRALESAPWLLLMLGLALRSSRFLRREPRVTVCKGSVLAPRRAAVFSGDVVRALQGKS
jgi:hypothetical protein